MAKKRKSDNRLAKEREEGHKRIEQKIIKKEQKKLEEGMIAREKALGDAGVKQEYNYVDHQHIYNYGNDNEGAPIETIGDKIAKCKKCGYLKDGTLPEDKQCRCNWAARGWDSESPSSSQPSSPRLARKRASSPCPSSFNIKPNPRACDAARYARAAKVFLESMKAGK
jgi:hypothetical protein